MKLAKLHDCMDPSARRIKDALQTVSQLRQQHDADPALARASTEVKRFQARRFQATYADLLQSPRYKTATRFFLNELYSEQDYAERDQQFARIANGIARLFPQSVVKTAAPLAEVHALTETLDDLMARQWLTNGLRAPRDTDCARYIRCWQHVGDAAARGQQLERVLQLGQALNRLTRTRGLRTLLRMMRHPAAAAGLATLQHFLESGFDAFSAMHGADEFLKVIDQRESAFIASLFDDDAVACETKLSRLLAAEPA